MSVREAFAREVQFFGTLLDLFLYALFTALVLALVNMRHDITVFERNESLRKHMFDNDYYRAVSISSVCCRYAIFFNSSPFIGAELLLWCVWHANVVPHFATLTLSRISQSKNCQWNLIFGAVLRKKNLRSLEWRIINSCYFPSTALSCNTFLSRHFLMVGYRQNVHGLLKARYQHMLTVCSHWYLFPYLIPWELETRLSWALLRVALLSIGLLSRVPLSHRLSYWHILYTRGLHIWRNFYGRRLINWII